MKKKSNRPPSCITPHGWLMLRYAFQQIQSTQLKLQSVDFVAGQAQLGNLMTNHQIESVQIINTRLLLIDKILRNGSRKDSSRHIVETFRTSQFKFYKI